MENLYHNHTTSPTYSYLPPNNNTLDNMYRSNSMDRPYHIDNEHNYGWSTSSNNHYYPNPPVYGYYKHNYHHYPVQNHIKTRPKITTNVWEDEGTLCFQVDAKGICVARRQDNDMINGTKLLNVVGMSRGKRDGILKNEKGRVVVKVGAMHLKGVWIPFNRARELAIKFKIFEILVPLFADEPSIYLYNNNQQMPKMIPSPLKCNMIPTVPKPMMNQSHDEFYVSHHQHPNRQSNSYLYSHQDETYYNKSSPYTTLDKHTTTTTTTTTTTAAAAAAAAASKSVGSTTPSSWFSPETPTAVLFQKEEGSTNKKRKLSESSYHEPSSPSTKKNKPNTLS